MARRPEVLVAARDTGDRLRAPRTNGALALAEGLQAIHAPLQNLLGGIAKDAEEKARTEAKTAALRTGGKALADAVRSGELEATQNPWFIDQYEQTAGALKGQQAVGQLLADSQSWPERNDQRKYAERFTLEMGKLAPVDAPASAQQGFLSAAAPLQQQALASNMEYNVSRIITEHTQDTSALLSSNLQAVYKANPKAPQADYDKVLQASRLSWLAVGGTNEKFNQLALQSYLGAATTAGAPELTAMIPQDLRNIATASGNAAEEIATASYRIEQAETYKATGELRRQKAAIEAEGMKAETTAWGIYGTKLITGDFSQREIMETLTAQGVSPQAVQFMLKNLASDVTANNSLYTAQVNLYGSNPENAAELLDIEAAAGATGMTAALKARVTEQVRSGHMDLADARRVMGKADTASKHFEAEGRADVREARAAARDDRRITIEQARALKDGRDETLGVVSTTLANAGDPILSKDPKARTYWSRRMDDAQHNHLAAHPDDYTGADKAAKDTLNGFLKERLARRLAAGQKKAPGLQSGGNPRGGK